MSGRAAGPARGAKPVASPCIGVCHMDPPTGLCEGCLRTIDEIMVWGSLDEASRLVVLRLLPARRQAWRALKASRQAQARAGEQED